MSKVGDFRPTGQQRDVIDHPGSCFVEACPGAGKTEVMVERARRLLEEFTDGRAVGFLSFTNAAVSELEGRLRRSRVLPPSVFPHFVGTFDGFVWQFLIAPFGVPECGEAPKLRPDLGNMTVGWGRKYPLKCFSPVTGEVLLETAKQEKVPADEVAPAIQKAAKSTWNRLLESGKVDFSAVRRLAVELIADEEMASRLGAALAGRFGEIIIDEAQDCNPQDLEIVRWLRRSGIRTTVICDPGQAIYGFRGGVGRELRGLAEEFPETGQLPITGNFRSTDTVCRAIAAFRPGMTSPDEPLGKHSDLNWPVYVLGYSGSGASQAIGHRFRELIEEKGLNPAVCPVVATGWNTASRAVGAPVLTESGHLVLRVASAVSRFHRAGDGRERSNALEAFHRALIAPRMEDRQTYHDYLSDRDITPDHWRAQMVPLIKDLRFDPTAGETPEDWLERARYALAPLLPDDKTPKQYLPRNSKLGEHLHPPDSLAVTGRSIHSVKGEEFPGVCLVISKRWAKQAIEFLESEAPEDMEEEVRKLYVGGSRASQLLMIVVPSAQKQRLCRRLSAFSVEYEDMGTA